MKSPSFSRSEFAVMGLLLLGGATFGAYRLNQAVYKANEPNIFEGATQIATPGEPLLFTYREVGQECNYIPWSGNVAMTLKEIELYQSYTAAARVDSRVRDCNSLLHDEKAPLLLIEVEIENIDAEEGEYSWHQVDVSTTDGTITVEQEAFELFSEAPFNDDGNYLRSVIWCVNGKTSNEHGNLVDLARGETTYITLGFTLEDGAENRLGDAFLIYGGAFFDRMSIGSPTFGG